MLFSVTQKRKISQSTQLNAPVIFFCWMQGRGTCAQRTTQQLAQELQGWASDSEKK